MFSRGLMEGIRVGVCDEFGTILWCGEVVNMLVVNSRIGRMEDVTQRWDGGSIVGKLEDETIFHDKKISKKNKKNACLGGHREGHGEVW